MKKTQSNRAWIVGDMAYIDVSTLRHPQAIAIVDRIDLPRILDGKGRWRAAKPGGLKTLYAWRWMGPRSSRQYVFMHRHVLRLRLGDGMMVDHANRNGLDNRMENLRLATPTQNISNSLRISSSGYRGVSLRPSGKWQAQIRVNGCQVHLGSYESRNAAARAYDNAAREVHGEFATLNFPEVSA